jgi:hypothetical protein
VKTLRIFVSLLGDVGRERVLAAHVLDRVQGEFSRRVKLDPYFWEHEPMRASTDYQGNIPKPSDFDILICILLSRLGSPLSEEYRRADGCPYASGTEYQFENAVEARQFSGKPELLVYRNRQQAHYSNRAKAATQGKNPTIRSLARFFETLVPES